MYASFKNSDLGSCTDHTFIKSSYQYIAGQLFETITDHYPVLLFFYGNINKCVEEKNDKIDRKKVLKLCEDEN